jgi:formylglycine-generating enzyme required for sulfatase activity
VHITREAPLPAVERAEAGNALAKLGDPRPGVGIDEEMELPDIVWCEVPAGPFLMGEGDERHRNESITEDYLISRYPITNGQFDAFVEAGGYEEARYWSEAEASGVWSGGQVKGRWDDEARDSPHDYGEPFNLSNHPVVGVSWYEALAFCRWLEERLRVSDEGVRIWRGDRIETLSVRSEGLAVRLPSGAEWERAARGTDGRLYPWGEEPDPNRANYDDTGIGTTSAVGCFPGGASPYGVEDLSGNVWEWTRSLWGTDWQEPDFHYPYDPEDGRENLEVAEDVYRVLRGGAFSITEHNVRCAVRFRYGPDYRWYNYGFRVVVAPFSPTSDL